MLFYSIIFFYAGCVLESKVGFSGFALVLVLTRNPQIEYLENKIHCFKVIDPLFAVGLGSEEDPFVIDNEVPQRSPCSSCAKESYTGPVELAENQLAGGNPLSRPEQSSEGGSDRSDDPTQLKPKGGGRTKAREGLQPKEEEEMIR